MQLVSEHRSEILAASGLFVRAGRVATEENKWADDLSRQSVDKVLVEARELGLTPYRVDLPPDLTCLRWLLDRVRA